MIYIAASHYRNIAISQFHCAVLLHVCLITLLHDRGSQNRKITVIAKSLCIVYIILRDAICDIAYQQFFKVFHCEFYVNACDAMEIASQFRDLSILLISKCLIIVCAMRCFLRSKIHKP